MGSARRGLLWGTWLAGTAVAVAVSWWGVRLVDRQVISERPAVLAEVGTAAPPTTSSPPTTTSSVPPPPPTPAPADARTVTMVGGVVAFAFADGEVRLDWARPNPGFDMEIRSSGPVEVDVRFRSDDHESRLRADHEAGQPRVRVEDDPD